MYFVCLVCQSSGWCIHYCQHSFTDLKEDNDNNTYVVCEDCGEQIETANSDDYYPY